MLDEQYLISRLIESDELAFKEIFHNYSQKVHRFVYRYVQDREIANDITQNIFIKLWERRNRLDINKPFRSFVFSISYTMVMDYFRQLPKGLENSISDGHLNEILQTTEQTDDLVIYHQTSSLYEQALDSLPARRREIFILSRHQGLSNKEIAEKLGISVKTVENQMTSTLATLKEYFTKAGFLAFIYFFL